MYPKKLEDQCWTQSDGRGTANRPKQSKTERHLTGAFRKKRRWHSRTRYNNNLSDPVSTESQSTEHKQRSANVF